MSVLAPSASWRFTLLAVAALGFTAAARADEPPPALTKPPKLTHFVEAQAPPDLAARGEAEVILTIDVDETGKVAAVEVAKSGGADLDAAALAAARQFEFEPGESMGKPVPVRITYRYRFVLKPPPAPPPPPAGTPGPTVPVAGKVLRKGDRAPQAGVAVIAGDGAGALRAVTDEAGRFTFEGGLPPGKHELHLRGPSTSPADLPVELRAGHGVELTTYVEAKERYASTVRGKRPVVETVEYSLDAQEVRHIPGTQGDTLKAVQNLPGVARAPFGLGQLPVWGSAPQDTRVYVNGVPLQALFHFGGLRSTVNSEVIQTLDFVPGAYQVEHGLGLGGVVDLETRAPRRDGYHGYAQMDLLDGSLSLEGPLTRTLSFTVAGRRSWIDATLPLFTTSTIQLTPVYYDYLGRVMWRPTDNDDVDIFLLGSDDKIKVVADLEDAALTANFDSHIYDHRLFVNWLRRLGGGATFTLTPSIGYSAPFQLGAQLGTTPTSLNTRVFVYGLRAVARVPMASWLRVDAGLDFEGGWWRVDRAGNPLVTTDATSGGSGGFSGEGGFGGGASGFATDNLRLSTNHFAPFVAAPITIYDKRLVVTPQLRLQILTFAGNPGTDSEFLNAYYSPEIRLAARFQLRPKLVLKGALGAYSQPPPSEALSPVFGNPELKPQAATHYVLGAGYDVTGTLHVELDAFWKNMSNLVVPADEPGQPLASNDGVGRAYGVQVMLRQQLWRNLYGWISYTLSRSERKDHPDEDWHRFAFDQPHVLAVIASYLLPRGFQAGLRYRVVSGNPITPVVGAFYDSNGDRYIPLTGQPFSARLSTFNQLDLRVDKVFTFDRWRFSLYLDVQNVFRATNPEALVYNFDFTVPTPVSGLPLLPVLGIRGDF